ncbi:MAG: cysteine hydrolase [Bdellovibrionales bacterium]|nr:cysteine hydrolase [Bdellovibrionales bacterium]
MDFRLDPKNTALLVIDMQNGFCHEDSAMGQSVGVEPQQSIVPRISEVIELCRQKQLPLFFSQQVHFSEDQTRLRKKLPTHFKKQTFVPCLQGTFEVDFYEPIARLVREDDHIISKHRASVFYDTNLLTRLRMLGIETLIVTGCNTEFCVAHSVRDAYAWDFELIVLSDAVAGIKEEHHRNCLKLFSDYFAIVMESSTLRNSFER